MIAYSTYYYILAPESMGVFNSSLIFAHKACRSMIAISSLASYHTLPSVTPLESVFHKINGSISVLLTASRSHGARRET